MGRVTTECEIDGLRIMTTQLAPRAAHKLAAKLGVLLGPVLGNISELTGESDVSAMAPMISQLFAALSDSESDELVEKIFAGTIVFDNRVNPKPKYELTNPIMIDEAFAGQLMTMYAALWFVLKANFQDFIDAASKLQGGAGEAVAAVVASAST